MVCPNIDCSYLKPDHPHVTVSKVMITTLQRTELEEVVLSKEKQKQQDLLSGEEEVVMESQA